MTTNIQLFIIILIFILIILIIHDNNIVNSSQSSNVSSNKISNKIPNISTNKIFNEIIKKNITINNVNRNYNIIIPKNKRITSILLGFHGGGENQDEFLSYTNYAEINECVIAPEGQRSNNSLTWQNAFPWLINSSYENDVLFIDTILYNHFNVNENQLSIENIYLTGKSDGAGFAMLFSNLSKYSSYIKGIGVCSGAYFGLDSITNFGAVDENNLFIGNYNTKIPKNIVIPKKYIPITIFHGTGDQVMPFKGANYVNKNAYKSDSLWNKIDTTVNMIESKVSSNTWTANNHNFVGYIVFTNNLKLINSNRVGTEYISNVYSSTTNDMILNYIIISEQNHCWSGHKNSGPDSSESNNFYLDATYLITKFFNIGKDYIPTIPTIPKNFMFSK